MGTILTLLFLGGIAFYAVHTIQKRERERIEAEAKPKNPTDVIGSIAKLLLDAAMKKKH